MRIRALRRDDAPLLDRLMADMSPRSRYQRFHAPKPRLTDADRAHLTDVGPDHLALVAVGPHDEPVGVARAVRLREDRSLAELAVAVVDARQRQGIGSELIARLARRASAAGVERLVARVLADSYVVGSLRRRGWRLAERDGSALTLVADAWRVAAQPAAAPTLARRVEAPAMMGR